MTSPFRKAYFDGHRDGALILVGEPLTLAESENGESYGIVESGPPRIRGSSARRLGCAFPFRSDNFVVMPVCIFDILSDF